MHGPSSKLIISFFNLFYLFYQMDRQKNLCIINFPVWSDIGNIGKKLHFNLQKRWLYLILNELHCRYYLELFCIHYVENVSFFYLRGQGSNLYFLNFLTSVFNIVMVIKSRRLRWAGRVARMEEGRSAFKILTEKPTGKRPLGRPRCSGRTILEWTLKR